MKKTKIIVPAMGLLLLGTAASVTGTVAWFSMNNSVAVTGMNVRTTVGSNILISATNSEPSYASSLDQPVSGVLEPVSTVNGVDFFYHSTIEHVAGDGHVTDTDFIEYDPSTNAGKDAFDANYGLNTTANEADCFGYKDYSFYIKATNGEAAARTLAMSRCNLTYQGGAVTDKAWRVAVFAVSTSTGTTVDDDTAAQVGNLKSILRLTSAAYFNDQAVAAEDAFGSVNAALDQASNLGTIASAATAYYKVVVRLWLEGNDTTCNNETYALLSGDYRLDLKFAMVNHLATPTPEAGVNMIDSLQNAVATNAGLVGTITLSGGTTGTIYNGETAASFQWYDAADNTAIDGATTYQYTAAAERNVYCLVTTARGNIYRSNTVHLVAA